MDKLLLPDIINWQKACPELPLTTNDMYWNYRLRRALESEGRTLTHNYVSAFQVYQQAEDAWDIEDEMPDNPLYLAARYGGPDLLKICLEWDDQDINDGLEGAIAGTVKMPSTF